MALWKDLIYRFHVKRGNQGTPDKANDETVQIWGPKYASDLIEVIIIIPVHQHNSVTSLVAKLTPQSAIWHFKKNLYIDFSSNEESQAHLIKQMMKVYKFGAPSMQATPLKSSVSPRYTNTTQ